MGHEEHEEPDQGSQKTPPGPAPKGKRFGPGEDKQAKMHERKDPGRRDKSRGVRGRR